MNSESSDERGRDSLLYVQNTTLQCALKTSCVPCLYKIFPDGKDDKLLNTVLPDVGVLRFPCNQRPELCPRSKISDKQTGIYTDQLRGASEHDEQKLEILTVGDGDFSFSLSLGNSILKGNRVPAALTATSHESLQSVLTTYQPHSKDTLARLKSLGATVLHGVDATNLAATKELHRESSSTKQSDDGGVKMKRFDYVIWNFPCLSLPAGADGQATELQANQELLSKFFSKVHSLLKKHTGEVHISHKTVEPFSWWGIKKLAANNGFEFAYAIVFDRCNYPGYTNRKALDRKSFPCNDAQIYVFAPTKRVKKMRKALAAAESVSSGSAADRPATDTALSIAAQRTHLPLLLEHNVLVPTMGEEFISRMRAHLLQHYSGDATSSDNIVEPAAKKHKKF